MVVYKLCTQYLACNFLLGIGKYAPNAAAQGDMGWKMSLHRRLEFNEATFNEVARYTH